MNRSHPRNKRELPKNNSHQNINVRSEPTAPTRISEALSSMTYKAWNYSRNRNMKLSLPTDNSHHVGWAKLSCKILAVMVQQVFIQYLFRLFFFSVFNIYLFNGGPEMFNFSSTKSSNSPQLRLFSCIFPYEVSYPHDDEPH